LPILGHPSAQYQYIVSEEYAQDPEEGCRGETIRFGRSKRRTKNKVDEEWRKDNIT
jgi:superfamily II helicase